MRQPDFVYYILGPFVRWVLNLIEKYDKEDDQRPSE